MPPKKISEFVLKVANDPKRGFHGKSDLLEKVGKAHKGARRAYEKDVNKLFQEKEALNIYQRRRLNYPRRPTIQRGLDYQWQADLADLKYIQEFNDNYRYLLCIIDIFSRYSWVIPLKTKTGKEMTEAFKKLFEETDRRPKKLQFDQGKEFLNKQLTNFLHKQGIYTFNVYSDTKAAFVERFQRTLKLMITRYLKANHTNEYLSVLPDLIYNYNHSVHRMLGMKPAEVNSKNEAYLLKKFEEDAKKQINKAFQGKKENRTLFKVGDVVRISRYKGAFEKEMDNNFSLELFRIKRKKRTKPITYVIEDLSGEEIKGSFYAPELIKAAEQEYYTIEEILKTKGPKNKPTEALVKWEGYPNPEWIPYSNIKDIVDLMKGDKEHIEEKEKEEEEEEVETQAVEEEPKKTRRGRRKKGGEIKHLIDWLGAQSARKK